MPERTLPQKRSRRALAVATDRFISSGKRIVEAATKGERDPARLRAAGLAAWGYDREAI
jgi:hypothetical protein